MSTDPIEARTAAPSKSCSKCKVEKPRTAEFFARHPRSADKMQSQCRACANASSRAYAANNREKIAARKKAAAVHKRPETQAYMRAYYKANKERVDAANLARYYADREAISVQRKADRAANPVKHQNQRRLAAYGISAEQYAEMVARQKGRCEVCDEAPDKGGLHVDHNHATGAVRGLLCVRCNTALGKLRDDPRILRAGANYLEKYQDAGSSLAGSPHDGLEVQVAVQVNPTSEG